MSDQDVKRIESEVRGAARDHLRAPDAAAALSEFTEDAVLVSNGRWYSKGEWTEVVDEFYGTLAEIHIAEWEEMRVDVVGTDAAVVTARFRWFSTDTRGDTIDLKGVWTALYVREAERWRIRVRHESFGSAES